MLQIQQNTAARLVTKLSWYTPTETLMQQCGWLSVNQLIHYHSLLLLHKAMIENKPEFINKNIRYPNRETRYNLLQDKRRFKTATAIKSFLPRSITLWNSLPNTLQHSDDHASFKSQLKQYIKENVPLR